LAGKRKRKIPKRRRRPTGGDSEQTLPLEEEWLVGADSAMLDAAMLDAAMLDAAMPGAAMPGAAWFDDEGLHALLPGQPPDQATLERLTQQYQQQIRNSPMWDEMVREFGAKKAEELLRQCRAELR